MSTLTVTNTKLNHAGGGVAGQGNAGINLVATGTANVKWWSAVVRSEQRRGRHPGHRRLRHERTDGHQRCGHGQFRASRRSQRSDMGQRRRDELRINLGRPEPRFRGTGSTTSSSPTQALAPNDGGSASAIGLCRPEPARSTSQSPTTRLGWSGAPRSGNENFFGIAGDIQDSGTVRVDISNNTVRNTALNGIFIQTRDPARSQGT